MLFIEQLLAPKISWVKLSPIYSELIFFIMLFYFGQDGDICKYSLSGMQKRLKGLEEKKPHTLEYLEQNIKMQTSILCISPLRTLRVFGLLLRSLHRKSMLLQLQTAIEQVDRDRGEKTLHCDSD